MLVRPDDEVEAEGSAWEPGEVLDIGCLEQLAVSFYKACGE
jgi:hypothetical protein